MAQKRRKRTRRRRKTMKGKGARENMNKFGKALGKVLEGVTGYGSIFNPSGKRRPKGFARAVLSGRSHQFKQDYIKKHGPGSWHWG